MKFTKMHGAGNDYIYVNCFEEKIENPGDTAIAVSDRHFGIGSDGLVLILPSDKGDFKMDMYNADGSRGKMCGNAIRCVAKYVYDNKMTDREEIAIETLSGMKYIKLFTENGIAVGATVNMGEPILKPRDIPVNIDGEAVIDKATVIGTTEYKITCVSMGNPHCVVYVNSVDDLPLEKIGPTFENDKIFPERVNTEFVEIVDGTSLKMRVWERGSGETLACGTGACACVAASILNGYYTKDSDIRVILRGGELSVKWDSESNNIFMTGPAKTICTGNFEIK